MSTTHTWHRLPATGVAERYRHLPLHGGQGLEHASRPAGRDARGRVGIHLARSIAMGRISNVLRVGADSCCLERQTSDARNDTCLRCRSMMLCSCASAQASEQLRQRASQHPRMRALPFHAALHAGSITMHHAVPSPPSHFWRFRVDMKFWQSVTTRDRHYRRCPQTGMSTDNLRKRHKTGPKQVLKHMPAALRHHLRDANIIKKYGCKLCHNETERAPVSQHHFVSATQCAENKTNNVDTPAQAARHARGQDDVRIQSL